MNFSGRDIFYVVRRCSPNKEHGSALLRGVKYLRGTMNYDILYSFPFTLEGYCGANWIWISDSDYTKSTSGYGSP